MRFLALLLLLSAGSFAHAGHWICTASSDEFLIDIKGTFDPIAPANPFIISGTINFLNEANVGLPAMDLSTSFFRRAYVDKHGVSFDLHWEALPTESYKSAVDINVNAQMDPREGAMQGQVMVHKFYGSTDPKVFYDKTFDKIVVWCDAVL